MYVLALSFCVLRACYEIKYVVLGAKHAAKLKKVFYRLLSPSYGFKNSFGFSGSVLYRKKLVYGIPSCLWKFNKTSFFSLNRIILLSYIYYNWEKKDTFSYHVWSFMVAWQLTHGSRDCDPKSRLDLYIGWVCLPACTWPSRFGIVSLSERNFQQILPNTFGSNWGRAG